jgi:hypothetical protein
MQVPARGYKLFGFDDKRRRQQTPTGECITASREGAREVRRVLKGWKDRGFEKCA